MGLGRAKLWVFEPGAAVEEHHVLVSGYLSPCHELFQSAECGGTFWAGVDAFGCGYVVHGGDDFRVFYGEGGASAAADGL